MRRAAIVSLLVTLVLGMISNLLFLFAFQFRIEWFLDPAQLVSAGSTSATFLRWAAVADLLSYYLPTAIVAVVLWHVLRPRSPLLTDLATLGALAYVVTGGSAAAALALAGPLLLDAYATAGPDQAAIATVFAVLVEVVWRGVWQLFDMLVVGAWVIGLGVLLRTDQVGFARLSWTLGGLMWLVAALNGLELPLAKDIVLAAVFALLTAWSIWLIVLLKSRATPFDSLA
ncbi:MAG: DUF4386 family protein [Acidimicrobiia bacterium]